MEGFVEIVECWNPVCFAVSDVVQGLFHVCGEFVVYDVWKMFYEKVAYNAGDVCWFEFFVVISFDVAAVDDGVNGWGIG